MVLETSQGRSRGPGDGGEQSPARATTPGSAFTAQPSSVSDAGAGAGGGLRVPREPAQGSDERTGAAAGAAGRGQPRERRGRRGRQGRQTDVLNHDILTREEEVALSQRVVAMVEAEGKRDELLVELGRKPSFGEWAEYIGVDEEELKVRLTQGLQAKKAFVRANMRLVDKVVRDISNGAKGSRGALYEDLMQEGVFGLVRAAEKFRPDIGTRFGTYAYFWIRQVVQRATYSISRTIRIPDYMRVDVSALHVASTELHAELGRRPTDEELAARLGKTEKKVRMTQQAAMTTVSLSVEKGSSGAAGRASSLGDSIADSAEEEPEHRFEKQHLQDDVRSILCGTLSEREQYVLRLRFNLNGEFQRPWTLQEIADTLDISRERVRQIEFKAVEKLRKPFLEQRDRQEPDDDTIRGWVQNVSRLLEVNENSGSMPSDGDRA